MVDIDNFFPVSPIADVYGKATKNKLIGSLAGVSGANNGGGGNVDVWEVDSIEATWDGNENQYNTVIYFNEVPDHNANIEFSFVDPSQTYHGNAVCPVSQCWENENELVLFEGEDEWILPKGVDDKAYTRGKVSINNGTNVIVWPFHVVESQPIATTNTVEAVTNTENGVVIYFKNPFGYEYGKYYWYKITGGYEIVTNCVDSWENPQTLVLQDKITATDFQIEILFVDEEHAGMYNVNGWSACQNLEGLYELSFYPYSQIIVTYPFEN